MKSIKKGEFKITVLPSLFTNYHEIAPPPLFPIDNKGGDSKNFVIEPDCSVEAVEKSKKHEINPFVQPDNKNDDFLETKFQTKTN